MPFSHQVAHPYREGGSNPTGTMAPFQPYAWLNFAVEVAQVQL